MRLGVEAVKSFDGDLRLSRSHGDVQWANAHKPSDLLSVGDAGSLTVAIAKDLKRAGGWGERAGRVFGGPGWQPARQPEQAPAADQDTATVKETAA